MKNFNLKDKANNYKLTEEQFKNYTDKIFELNNSKATIYFFNTINNLNLGTSKFIEIKKKIDRLNELNRKLKNGQKYLDKNSPIINEICNDLLFSITLTSNV